MKAMRNVCRVVLLSALALGGCVDDPSDGEDELGSEDELPSEDDESTTTAELSLPPCTSYSGYQVSYGYDYVRPTYGYNTRNTNCYLATWNQGDGVKVLQNALRTCYHQNIAVDGFFGWQTREAVKNVQRFHGLYADGVFGPHTGNSMVWPIYSLWSINPICWY